MTANQWARLRQVGFATLDHAAAVRTATDVLALGPGFGDPLLAAMGLADFTAPVGPDTYVEVLAPTTPGHSVARWLRRVGGASGWVLSTQVPSLAGVRERAAEQGVRIAVETQAMGRTIIQLHPLDVGVLLELDEFLPCEAWFWDELPAAQAARAARTSKADDILAVDVAVDATASPGAPPRWRGPGPRSSASTRPRPPRTAPTSPSATAPSGSYPPATAAPASSPSTCTPPTATASPAQPANCATRRSASPDPPRPPVRSHSRAGAT
jgi:hypothetical protein